jgi:hypothetical protein
VPVDFIVFGPHVHAPANSNLWVDFDIVADMPLAVTSDAISEVDRRFHAAMNEQPIAKGERRNLGFGTHLSEPTTGLETRIAIRADKLAKFTIKNLSVRIE